MKQETRMEPIRLEKQEAEPVDEATKAALEVGRAQLRRGEGIPLEQVRKNLEERYQEWLKTQEPALTG
jgi:hypothetical protein